MTIPTIPKKCRRKKQCRLHYGYGRTTCMAWTPVYDGHGNLLNQDPNTTTQAIECDTCGGAWIETRQGGNVTWESIPPECGRLMSPSGRDR